MRKLIGKGADFVESKVRSPRDTLMSIQMSAQFWKSGESGTQSKFLSQVSKLKDEIHDGVKGSELKFQKLHNKCQHAVQPHIDKVDARKNARPKINAVQDEKTFMTSVQPPLSSSERASRLLKEKSNSPQESATLGDDDKPHVKKTHVEIEKCSDGDPNVDDEMDDVACEVDQKIARELEMRKFLPARVAIAHSMNVECQPSSEELGFVKHVKLSTLNKMQSAIRKMESQP